MAMRMKQDLPFCLLDVDCRAAELNKKPTDANRKNKVFATISQCIFLTCRWVKTPNGLPVSGGRCSAEKAERNHGNQWWLKLRWQEIMWTWKKKHQLAKQTCSLAENFTDMELTHLFLKDLRGAYFFQGSQIKELSTSLPDSSLGLLSIELLVSQMDPNGHGLYGSVHAKLETGGPWPHFSELSLATYHIRRTWEMLLSHRACGYPVYLWHPRLAWWPHGFKYCQTSNVLQNL